MADSQRGTEQQGTIHNCVTLREPILAQLTTPTVTGSARSGQRSGAGETFNIIAIGDVEGHSPSACGVDSNGYLSWQSFDNVRVVDGRYLPPTSQNLQERSRSMSAEFSRT